MNMLLITRTVKQILVFSICSIMLLILSGCWDRIEVNDLAIVVATGLDKNEEGEIELSAQIVNPKIMGGQASGGAGKLTTIEETTGKTIFDARSKLQEKVSRKLFWGHNRVIIIGENMAEEGIQKHIDFFARHPFPRLRAFVFVTKGQPVEILKVTPDLERTSSEVAKELAAMKISMSVSAKELLQMLSSGEGGAALPLIQIEEEPPNTIGLQVKGAAVFKNGKMVGQIDDEMVRGVLWLRDEIETAAVTVEPEKDEGLISFHIFRSTTKLTPLIEKGKWKMKIEILSEDDIVENESKLDVMNPEIVESLQGQLEQQIVERIQLALDTVQKEMKADIFGFGQAFHRHYPDQWAKEKDNWDEIFSEMEVEIKSEVKVRRPGRSTSPQGVPEDEVIGN